MKHLVNLGMVGAALVLFSGSAMARTVEPGSFSVSGALGPSVRVGKSLGGASGYGMLYLDADYAFSKAFAVTADVTVGVSGTQLLRFDIGPRWRRTDLALPLSPYVQVQVAALRLFNVIGADLTVLGGRVASGLDYFFTANLGVGGLFAFTAGTTLSEYPVYYGVFDMLLYGRWWF